MYQQEIPIFFAVDDAYIPFLAVTIQSIFENKSEKNLYKIKILYTKITDENKKEILKYSKENINIEFVNVEENLKKLKDKLLVRDYYSDATYYRILIPNMFQEYDKILYLDADIVVLDDIANLYNINLENNLVGGAPEPWFKEYEEFQVYAEKVIEVQNYKEYINVGVLLMNLKELRKMDFENVFINLLDTKKFTLLQDEDYINKICNGRIKYIDEKWNVSGYLYDNSDPKIVHYTIFKPWLKKEMLNKEYFWDYAKKTPFYEYISSLMSEETEEKGDISLREFRKMAISEVKNKVNDNNETEIQSSFEHIKLAEIDSLNWNEVNMLSDYFQGEHYEVFRDGYVYSYESYNLSGKKNEKNFKISTEDIAKIEKILKSNIDNPRDNSGADGTGWTFKYYDIEGNIVGKYTGYIYQYKEFNDILELLKK